MPDWLSAIILGMVEGLTEFIPVSSTGHLLLAKEALGLPDGFWDTFAVMIQLGAILAVVVLYFQRLWGVVLRLPSDPEARRFALSVIIAFIPSVIFGLLLYGFIKEYLFTSVAVICWSLLIGGIGLLFLDRWSPPARHHDAMKTPLLTALGVGIMQCFAMVPGVSRSGATIVGGVLMGMDKKAAAEFSFFLAIPTMVAAFTLDFWESREVLLGSTDRLWIIAIGFVVSFVSGWFVIRTMLDFIGKYGLGPFGWWRILVGGIGLGVLYFT